MAAARYCGTMHTDWAVCERRAGWRGWMGGCCGAARAVGKCRLVSGGWRRRAFWPVAPASRGPRAGERPQGRSRSCRPGITQRPARNQARSAPRERRPVGAGWRYCYRLAPRRGRRGLATIKRPTPTWKAPPHGAALVLCLAEFLPSTFPEQGPKAPRRGTRGVAPPRERRPVRAGWRYCHRLALRQGRMHLATIKRPTPTSEAPPHGAALALPSRTTAHAPFMVTATLPYRTLQGNQRVTTCPHVDTPIHPPNAPENPRETARASPRLTQRQPPATLPLSAARAAPGGRARP